MARDRCEPDRDAQAGSATDSTRRNTRCHTPRPRGVALSLVALYFPTVKVRFWGTRGSIATPGPNTVRFGGNTSCVQVTTDKGTLLILDCGTGARLLGDYLMQSCGPPIRGHIFLTHTHWDHIQGFPFFAPTFTPGNEWMVYGPADGERHLEQALAGQMQYTYFPVDLEHIGATLRCLNLDEGSLQIDDVNIRSQYLNHPAVTLGYRVEVGGRCLVYATDHEPFSPVLFKQDTDRPSMEAILHASDRRHAEFLAGADLVIHDAQYTEREYESKRTWGHSTIDYVIQTAGVAGAKRLALYHHDPTHDDATLEALEEQARSLAHEYAPRMEVFFAREGTELTLEEEGWASPGRGDQVAAPTVPRKLRILAIDDDVIIRELVREILQTDDYVVDLAGDGEEGLATIESRMPDLVLLDMTMPKLDGIGVVSRLRSQVLTRNLPVIMLTARSDEECIEQGFAAGATDYMLKPFSPAQLRARISGWLRRAAQGTLESA